MGMLLTLPDELLLGALSRRHNIPKVTFRAHPRWGVCPELACGQSLYAVWRTLHRRQIRATSFWSKY